MPANLPDRSAPQGDDHSDEAAVLGQRQPPRRALAKLRADLIIFALWILICAPQATGLGLHEWVSFAFVPFFVLHLLLSWKWIVNVTRRLLGRVPGRTRFNYLWNTGLFVLMVACIVSGVVVSEVALPALGLEAGHDPFWGGLHDATANLLLVGVGVHLALHWPWIRGVFRRHRSGPRAPWRQGGWREAVRPLPLAGLLGAMVAVGVLALPLDSSVWAEEARAEEARAEEARAEEAERAATDLAASEDASDRSAADPPRTSEDRRAPRGDEESQGSEPRQRRFPSWARYVLPFVKQAVLMGVPALASLALLAIVALFRRRRRS